MRDHPDALMIFAAGFGTRMGALTKERPKPLIEVGGRALIDHTLDLAKAITPRQIVANLHYMPEPLRAHLTPKGVALSHEVPEILETGGGLRAALSLLGSDTVFTANSDAIWRGPNPFVLLRDAWRPEVMDALLLCVPPAKALGHAGAGDFRIDSEGRLTRGPGAIYGGIQIIKTERLQEIPENTFSLNILWDVFANEDRLFGVSYPGDWCDVGHPEGIALAETLLEPHDV